MHCYRIQTKVYHRGAHIFQKFTSHLKILDSTRNVRHTFHAEDPQILRATLQNLVTPVIGRQAFVHPWLYHTWNRIQYWLCSPSCVTLKKSMVLGHSPLCLLSCLWHTKLSSNSGRCMEIGCDTAPDKCCL